MKKSIHHKQHLSLTLIVCLLAMSCGDDTETVIDSKCHALQQQVVILPNEAIEISLMVSLRTAEGDLILAPLDGNVFDFDSPQALPEDLDEIVVLPGDNEGTFSMSVPKSVFDSAHSEPVELIIEVSRDKYDSHSLVIDFLAIETDHKSSCPEVTTYTVEPTPKGLEFILEEN